MGLELELLPTSQLPPIRTAAAATARHQDGSSADDAGCATPKSTTNISAVADAGFATPKSTANMLRPQSACPPAPRKPRPAKRKPTHHRGRSCGSAAPAVRWFVAVPHDVLAAAFVARPAASAPRPTSPASKKIRVHVVG